jgi:hypothetical protein
MVGVAIFVLGGCAEEDPEGGTGPTTSDSEQENTGRKVLVDEVIYSKSRYPEDLKEGQRLKISVEVVKGGPLILDIANVDTEESVFQKIIETTRTMEFKVKNDGTHYITFQGMDEAEIKVVRIED